MEEHAKHPDSPEVFLEAKTGQPYTLHRLYSVERGTASGDWVSTAPAEREGDGVMTVREWAGYWQEQYDAPAVRRTTTDMYWKTTSSPAWGSGN